MASQESIQYWLWQPDANPVVLVDCVHTAGTRRISTYPYTTRPNDTPANETYDDMIVGGVTIAAAIGSNQTVGSLEFFALEGEEAFEWGSYQMWIGDIAWPFAQFAPLAAGTIKKATRPDLKRLRLEFADPSELLKTPVLTAKTNDDLTPLVLGSALNISPIVEDASIAKYRASYLTCTIIEVRDNGVPVSKIDHANGSFTLIANPVGQVTVDAANAYDTVPAACAYLAGLKGVNLQGTVNFTAAQTTAKIGMYITDAGVTIWDAINELCASIGAFPRFNELGQFELVHIPHAGAASVTLENDDILKRSASQQDVLDKASVQLNYRKNWTPQTQLAASVSVADRDFYAKAFTQIDVANSNTKDKQIIDTLLTDPAQANAEATRRAVHWSANRETWRVSAVLPALTVQLGQRIGLDIEGVIVGKVGTVVSWTKRADRKITELELLL